MNGLSAVVFAPLSFLLYVVLSFLIPSSSGMATVSMPIMGPLANSLGFSPDVMIMIYSAGNGLVNLFTPTSGAIMGGLALARVEYSTWLKFGAKLFVVLGVVCLIVLTIAMMLVPGPPPRRLSRRLRRFRLGSGVCGASRHAAGSPCCMAGGSERLSHPNVLNVLVHLDRPVRPVPRTLVERFGAALRVQAHLRGAGLAGQALGLRQQGGSQPVSPLVGEHGKAAEDPSAGSAGPVVGEYPRAARKLAVDAQRHVHGALVAVGVVELVSEALLLHENARAHHARAFEVPLLERQLHRIASFSVGCGGAGPASDVRQR